MWQQSNNPNNQTISTIKQSSNITFPLDSFLQRLELAGFYISPADRLRVLRLLDGLGTANLQEPEKLKTLLCPLLAHSKADQERFYELFDRYWEEVSRPWEVPPPPRPAPWWQRIPDWVRWLLLVLLIAGMGWGIWKLVQKEKVPDVVFQHPPTVKMGEAIRFLNGSKNVDSTAMRWEIIDAETKEAEHVEEDSFHLTFLIEKMGASPNKQVRLTALNNIDKTTGKPKTHEKSFRILCAEMPVVDSIIAPRETRVNAEVSFEAQLPDTAGLTLEWNFDDGSTATGTSAKHRFSDSRTFNVTFTATRPGVEGFCEKTLDHRISVGQDVAVLAAKTLYPDEVAPIVNFSWGTWILLGLLGLAMIWFWVKWAVRKPPPVPEETEDLTAAAERFKAVDKGPYFIPFRSQEGYVRVERELYRLADVLRRRQEGLRKNLDVPTSVSRTIADGGFPQLVTRADTVPTEYLFLIDEQTYGSHQSHLFRFLVNFLREREVLGEVFYFKNEPIRFWNDQHPDGMMPEQLRRLYPLHRLIVLGDAHAMLDPAATGKPRVRPSVSDYFRQWKQRLLLTPMPVVSWTYREGALHGLFSVFPSDTDGIGEAIKFLERGMEEEDLPTYAAWCERLLEGRVEPDVNYRRWRTAEEHQDYLKDHPALYRWLCAVAVYPKPDWNITLAIGHALSGAIPAAGVVPKAGEFNSPAFGTTPAVNYDNLLILSRIPWLQSGDLSPRLRKELLAGLDPATERIARETVQAELEAVETLVQGSHANQEQQINLAIQNFALAPEDPETQDVIRQLQGLKLLTSRHIAELNQTLERQVAQGQPSTLHRPPSTVLEFLEENRPKPEPPRKPFFTKNFWLASAATVLYLMIFLFAWNMGGTESLAGMVGVKSDPSTDCKEEYLAAGFLKKECFADSAVIYNNLGVEAYNFAATTPDTTEKNRALESSWAFLKRAEELDPAYQLAKANLGKFHFNSGKTFYDYYHNVRDSLPAEVAGQILNSARISFELAAGFDSVRLDAWHGAGLSDFYLENFDSATVYRDRLLTATQDQYFNGLDLPHLHSLLIGREAKNRVQAIVLVQDKKTGNPLSGVAVTVGDFTGRTRPDGMLEVEMLVGVQQRFNFEKSGYDPLRGQTFTPGADNLLFSVRMEPEVKQPVALRSSQSVIYFDFDKITLRRDAQLALDSLLAVLMKNPDWTVSVTGHTDSQGTDAYNLQISERLAEVVVKYLVSKGISRERLTSLGRGESQLAVPGNAAANRRVEIRIVKPESPAQSLPPDEKPIQTVPPDKNPEQSPPANTRDIPTPEMVFVKGGTFRMGCDEKRDGDCQENEQPVHDVTLDDFYIGKYEVTQELWEAVMGENPSYFKDCPKCPVEQVSWDDVQGFIQKLNQLTGQNYRLPTEAEWEYAARGGSSSRMTKYSGSNEPGQVAWYEGNSGGKTHPVGQKNGNELDIFDMSGNVWEWCSDWYDEKYYRQFEKAGIRNPQGPVEGSDRVHRGGSWNNAPNILRCLHRDFSNPDFKNGILGFRLARAAR